MLDEREEVSQVVREDTHDFMTHDLLFSTCGGVLR